ncbi:MAG: formate dehydrogenase accessory sulfurtransferase FdhD, partial [Planctomycetes bacterium]|nr:formate dehydrogenase accessory sulfurtransferase FdhD [Planctomycetota bacterium]
IGQAARAGVDLSGCVAVLSGRAGFDLVVKCLRTRIPIIVSVSAPSALAFDLCEAAGATLIGFARTDRHETYCHPDRLT